MKAKEQRTTSAQPNEDTPLLLGLRVDQPFNNINCVSSRNKTAIWVILNAGVVTFVVLLLSVVAYSIAPDPPIVSYTLTLTYGYASPDGKSSPRSSITRRLRHACLLAHILK